MALSRLWVGVAICGDLPSPFLKLKKTIWFKHEMFSSISFLNKNGLVQF